MSEYNYLGNINATTPVDDEVAKEFDILNDEIVKYTGGRGEIVYSTMLSEEKRIWFNSDQLEEGYFIDFLSHVKNEKLKDMELTNRLACVSYSNMSFPVLCNSPLAELNLQECKRCETQSELRNFIQGIVNTKAFRNILIRAKKGSFMQNNNYVIDFFFEAGIFILFAAEYQETGANWFGYISMGNESVTMQPIVLTSNAESVVELKRALVEKCQEIAGYSISLNNSISLNRVNPRILFRLYDKACLVPEISINCRLVQTMLDRIVPGGPTLR